MPVRKRRSVKLLVIFSVLTATISILSAASADQASFSNSGKEHKQFLPVLFSAPAPAPVTARDLINQLRASAGVPAVRFTPTLNRNCFEHARYMAENVELTHNQHPSHPFATSNGQTCARQANIWLGSARPMTPWQGQDAVNSWILSVSHRIWLLYPTTEVFGYGFHTSENNYGAAAALDVLSGADFGADTSFNGWPVRYPSSGEQDIPASQFPITLNWPFFGPEPVLQRVRLTTANGKSIAHESTTQMAIGHKGIQIIPQTNLPRQSKIFVTVTGKYEGASFSYSWHFYTSANPNTSPEMELVTGN